MCEKEQISQIAEIVGKCDCDDCDNCSYSGWWNGDLECFDYKIASAIYNAGYRKQSEGEWVDSLKGYCQCSNCRTSFETLPTTFLFKLNNRFCRNCGAKMKGGAE